MTRSIRGIRAHGDAGRASSCADAREWASVGEWARDVLATHWAVPREVLVGGRWRYNRERVATGKAAAGARVAVAHHGGFPLADVGACAACGALCHRYGGGGNPLCVTCLAKARARRGEAR